MRNLFGNKVSLAEFTSQPMNIALLPFTAALHDLAANFSY
jgi:hypothetical protein